MLLLFLATAAVQAAPFTLEELPTQKAMPGRCVTFLWTRNTPPLRIAMIDESAGTLRIKTNGKERDLARAAPAGVARYADTELSITLNLDIEARDGLAGGAVVEQGSARIEQPGQDALVVPVGGIRACQ